MSSKGVVLVSGVTGYIGAHVAREFLVNGYSVRGTVRDLQRSSGQEHLERWKNEGKNIEVVQADLLDAKSWQKACEGVDYVAHVASPFFVSCPPSEAEEKLYKPAKQGTLNVLQAAQAAGVKKVVVTSSVAAIVAGHPPETFDGIEPETIWTNTKAKGMDPYPISKTIAEKAAWDFVEELRAKGEKVFELATINPSFVLGPPVSTGSATSHTFPMRLIKGSVPMIPDTYQNTVDVRDVAKAHRLAIEKEEANGQRLVCSANNNRSFVHWAKVLHEEFEQYGYKIATRKAPYFLLFIAGLFDSEVRAIKGSVGKKIANVSNAKIKRVLGLEFNDEDDMLKSHLHGCIQIGVKGFFKTKKYEDALNSGEIQATIR